MLDYINGNKFADLAHYKIDLDNKEINFDLSKNMIIFCKTDFIDELFDYIRGSKSNYILTTHMSDKPINKERYAKKPDCVKKWFAQNAVYDKKDLISIPLGLENHKGGSKGGFTDHKWFMDNYERLKKRPKSLDLYCNWSNFTSKGRWNVLDKLKSTGVNLFIENSLTFKEYCNHMARYKFVVCPQGNGVDTHRVWEALYLGCFPIVIKHRIYNNYDLPIMQVNDFSEISLYELGLFLQKFYNYEMLYMDYWKNRIVNEFFNL